MLNHVRSKKGWKRLERKVERERRLGRSIRAALKYECAVSDLISLIVWDG